jgi:hypothetical protein
MKSEADDSYPRRVYVQCCQYLFEKGWVRDGDDLGLWINPKTGAVWNFGNALQVQLANDGISMGEEGTLEDEAAEAN